MRLASAANVVVPVVLLLESRGYVLQRTATGREKRNVDCPKSRLELIADDPWNCSDWPRSQRTAARTGQLRTPRSTTLLVVSCSDRLGSP
jgi:hypothetical protein